MTLKIITIDDESKKEMLLAVEKLIDEGRKNIEIKIKPNGKWTLR